MTTRKGQCSCGKLEVTCTGEPIRISVCHCLNCQRRTGGPFAEQARWPREQVTTSGEGTVFVRTGDEGTTASFHFCPTCGVTVWFVNDAMPETIVTPVGVFADPTFPAPTVSVYGTRKHSWVEVPTATERWD